MKKINSFILSAAAVFAFAACGNDTETDNPVKYNGPVYETISVKVGTENPTRATLATDATTAAFEDGDKIAVYNATGFNDYILTSGKITVDISGGARSDYAVCYTGATAPTFESSTLKITLPDTYDYAEVAGDKNPVPMVAVNQAGAAGDMTFYAVCALARITLTGIPATANKLIVNFGQEVTGLFTVDDPGTDHPTITSAGSATSQVTINLTPGTDYTGAVINIPVPKTFKGSNASAYIEAKNGDKLIDTQYTIFGSSWVPARAKGKKATVNFTPSIYSMIFTSGNLYTDGGTLKIASNWYSNIYNDNSATYVSGSYSASNRSHFNFNETAALMNGTAPSSLNYTTATTNAGSFEDKSVNISYTGYRVPTQAEWAAATTGASRPGASLSNNGGSTYTDGWKFVKVLVSGMGTDGTSNSDGTAYAAGSDYQAGLLLFPDNVKITGTFATLGTKNATNTAYATTTITKGNLQTLITAGGCAFLPAVGRWYNGSFGYVGTDGGYWSSTQYGSTTGYSFKFVAGEVTTQNYGKKEHFRAVRLVK